MATEKHIIVIGNGIAGITAALAARSKTAAPITVLGRAHGASFLTGSPIAVAPSAGNETTLQENLQALMQSDPFHPYVTSINDLNSITQPIVFMLEKLKDAAFSHLSLETQNMLLANERGAFREYAVAPFWSKELDFKKLSSCKITVVGFENTPYNKPEVISGLLQSKTSPEKGFTFDHLLIKNIYKRFGDYSARPELLAIHFDGNEFIGEEILSEIKKAPESDGWLFPPVLGIERTKNFFDSFAAQVKKPMAELTAVGHSVMAKRIIDSLEKTLSDKSISRLPISADSIETHNDMIVSVNTTEGQLLCSSCVLATGKFIGGGIKPGEMPSENLLGLPLSFLQFNPDETCNLHPIDAPMSHLTESAPHYLGYQSGLTTGVCTDDDFAPVDNSGIRLYQNLFAAGSLLTGYSPVHHQCGMGTAIYSGFYAGVNAAGFQEGQ